MTHGKNRTVMVVDDEDTIRTVVARMLAKHGYRVVPAANGREAVEWLRAGACVDLMVLDIMMPEMDGYETLRKLKDLGRSGLPVVMLSAKDMDRDILHGYCTGADYYITKPFKSKTLLSVVDYLIGDLPEPERVQIEARL